MTEAMRMSERPLAGRHAIVTGGGRGVGAAISARLAAGGMTLTIMGRSAEALAAHARDLMDEYAVEVQCVRCDVADERSVHAAFAEARERYPRPWALVSNAGEAAGASVVEMQRELWDRLIAVNLTGTMLCMQQVLEPMLAAGEGRIVNVASTAALRGYAGVAAYCASKHGVLGLTRAAAAEVAGRGITVNAVCPGYIEDTAMVDQAMNAVMARGRSEADARKMLLRGKPLGRFVTATEVASVVAWLVSPGASAITGQAVAVAGGEL
jgi:NAD(P)-dependent dehydrogenase (short-subunit alcohol dehydrogenase family)